MFGALTLASRGSRLDSDCGEPRSTTLLSLIVAFACVRCSDPPPPARGDFKQRVVGGENHDTKTPTAVAPFLGNVDVVVEEERVLVIPRPLDSGGSDTTEPAPAVVDLYSLAETIASLYAAAEPTAPTPKNSVRRDVDLQQRKAEAIEEARQAGWFRSLGGAVAPTKAAPRLLVASNVSAQRLLLVATLVADTGAYLGVMGKRTPMRAQVAFAAVWGRGVPEDSLGIVEIRESMLTATTKSMEQNVPLPREGRDWQRIVAVLEDVCSQEAFALQIADPSMTAGDLVRIMDELATTDVKHIVPAYRVIPTPPESKADFSAAFDDQQEGSADLLWGSP